LLNDVWTTGGFEKKKKKKIVMVVVMTPELISKWRGALVAERIRERKLLYIGISMCSSTVLCSGVPVVLRRRGREVFLWKGQKAGEGGLPIIGEAGGPLGFEPT